ncbi:MAG: DNA cytosine methyltransferase [Bacteroidales bacterium]|nr:DNA cytosine methyltransferase [Bacteroidales bacterium]
MKYSDWHKELQKTFNDGDIAYITHRKQSPNVYNGSMTSGIVSPLALAYDIDSVGEIEYDVPFPPVSNPDFTFIDLFAGIGGFRIPLQAEGGKCIFSSEFNPNAQNVYNTNYGDFPFGDITKIPVDLIPKHDVLCAGFPCQPFSISGKMRGFEDTRGTLIYNVFQIIKAKQPKIVFLENVKHLVHHDNGRTLKTILEGLDNLGYTHHPFKVLNASDFGVAQNRERIIIVAHKEKDFDFEQLQKKGRVFIKDIVDTNIDNYEYIKEPYTILDEFRPQESGLIFVGYRNKKIRKAGVRPGTEHLSRVHKQPNRIYSINGVHPALPSQETSGRFWIYDGKNVRKLTLNECYRLMGFPDTFIRDSSITEQYRQAGNAVCVPMIQEIVKQIKKQLL